MVFLPIYYFGKRGLESDILQSYLSLSGFHVDVVPAENGSLPSAVIPPHSIAVISLSSSEGARDLARAIARQTGKCAKVFIIEDGTPIGEVDGEAEIVPRPNQLSRLVKRIQSYSRKN